MIHFDTITEQNWSQFTSLEVHQEQRQFLDYRPLGILARGYLYRSCNARVYGISNNNNQPVGLALVKDLDEEPACYDLQQFLIDRRFQRQGYGGAALRLLLSRLSKERKYGHTEVCIHKENIAALQLFQKAGFQDTGYIDESLPDWRNLSYHFAVNSDSYSDTLVTDFSHPLFQRMFRQYFKELGLNIRDWDGLFREMNAEGDNSAFMRTDKDEQQAIGFIQFQPMRFSSRFFEETCGFIREFWVDPAFRGRCHGTGLLLLAENHFLENGIYTSILTTNTAAGFYESHGYRKAPGCKAKNQYKVFVKRLK